MKPASIAALAVVAFGARAFAAESVIPKSFDASRYQAMLDRSPFSLATPAAPPPAEPTKGFAADLYLTGLGKLDDMDFVTIKSRDLGTNFSLYGTQENKETGISLVSVDWSAQRGKSTVTIKKGTEFGKVEFNQAEITAAAPAPVPNAIARPAMPGVPRPVVPGGNQPPSVTTIPGTAPTTGIPRPTNISQPTQPPVPNSIVPPIPMPNVNPGSANQPGAQDSRRRIRIINPKQ